MTITAASFKNGFGAEIIGVDLVNQFLMMICSSYLMHLIIITF